MLFLTPLALLGLAAALVPPLLHLFQRRRPPELEFPAVRYLRQTEREAERQLKLRHLLLMVLRVLAIVFIVLAAARPVVPGGALALHEPTAVAIVLDDSLSSGTVTGGTRILDELSARARETLRAAQAGDAVWLIQADGIARRGTPAELLAVASAVRPDARRLTLSDAVRAAATVVQSSGYARREVHVLSDLQRTALETGTGNRQPATGTDSVMRDLPILVYHPAVAAPANRGVASARPRPAVWLAGASGTGSVVVEIAGGSSDPANAAAPIQLTMGSRQGARALAAAGAQAVLAAPRVESGWQRGVVTLESDELRADDERAFGVRVMPPAAVVMPAESDVGPFVLQALSVLADGGQIQPTTDLTRLTALKLTAGGTAPTANGTFIVFPPADLARAGALNRALAAAGVPWRFGPVVTRDDSLVAPAVPELAGARVTSRLRLETAVPADSTDVLARAGTDPWLVRHGRVVVVGSRLVPEQTSLPLSGAFVPFVSALVNRLARGESGVISALPGASVMLPARVASLAGADSTFSVEPGAVIEAPAVPGVYAMLTGSDTAGLLVVGHDPRESDLGRASSAEVSASWPGARASLTDDPRQYAARRFRGAGQSELTGWLLVLGLVTLVVEALVAAGLIRRSAASPVAKQA